MAASGDSSSQVVCVNAKVCGAGGLRAGFGVSQESPASDGQGRTLALPELPWIPALLGNLRGFWRLVSDPKLCSLLEAGRLRSDPV